jgi:selenocysteine lyase/cysteine desulfurase
MTVYLNGSSGCGSAIVGIIVLSHCILFLKVTATARASVYFYNTREEIDIFISALKETIAFFADLM